MSESDGNGGQEGYELETTTLQLEVESEPLQTFQLADERFEIGSSSAVERLNIGNVIFSSESCDYKHVSESDSMCGRNIVDTCTESADNETNNVENREPAAIENNVVYALNDEYYDETSNRNSRNVLAEASDLDSSKTTMSVIESELGNQGAVSGAIELVADNIDTLSSGMIVVLNGETCILQLDSATGHFIAYPAEMVSENNNRSSLHTPESVQHGLEVKSESDLVDGSCSKVVNGQIKLEPVSASEGGIVKLSEQENNAAEGLLGLAESQETSCGSVSAIDSSQAVSVNTCESKAEEARKLGVNTTLKVVNFCKHDVSRKQPLSVAGKECVPHAEKSTEKTVPGSSDGGGQVMYASSNKVQNFLASLGLPVKRGRGRPRRNPLPPNTTLSTLLPAPGNNCLPFSLPSLLPKPSADETQTSIIIEQEDGTEKHIVLSMPARKLTQSRSNLEPHIVCDNGFTVEQQQATSNEIHSATCSSATAETVVAGAVSELNVTAATSEPTDVSGSSAPTYTHFEIDESEETSVVSGLSSGAQLVFVVKKDPPKIGLRATEKDLAKLKCLKCDYQAYYAQQLQQHLKDSHADDLSDLVRCKCCTFLCFDDETLLSHMKASHPKCICTECNFMSEHPYVVKRHMQRHDATGCECYICGSRYKDQYILKMHIKMRHMEPEVLFQCNVCSKLFNRKAHLKRHLRIHNPDKPYKCPHCDYRGCERSDITKHILIHETPRHACDVCGKSFRHIKNKELHMKRHRGQRDYKCVCCDFYGYTFTDIRKHQERKHAGLIHTVACNACGAPFKSEEMLQLHRQSCCQIMAVQSEDGNETEPSDLIQYVSGGGGTVHLEIDGADLVPPEAHVIINGSQVTIEQLTEEGLGLMEVQMAVDDGMSVVDASSITEPTFIIASDSREHH